jgi:hypothetical protein
MDRLEIQEQQERREGFAAYGGPICVCCGETRTTALVLDRINSTGADEDLEDTALFLVKYQTNLCHELKGLKWPPGYQVLCLNCHIARGENDGVCPHKTKGTE